MTGQHRRRGGGRGGHVARRGHATLGRMLWRIPVNTDRRTELPGPGGVQAIHDRAMATLKDIGIASLKADRFRQSACTPRGNAVRMGRCRVVDMTADAPAPGTPDERRATQMTGQTARLDNPPLRAFGVRAADVPDGQATSDVSNSLRSAVHPGTNTVCHAAGWLDGAMIASAGILVMD